MRSPWWIAVALALAACEKEPPKKADAGSRAEQASKELAEAARQADVQKMGEAMGRMGEAVASGTRVEPVDFRRLRELFPEKAAGLKRTGSEGSKTNVMGIASSKASAVYEDGKGARIEADIIDVGTFTGVTSMAFAWINVEIDREGDDGYERTSTLSGRKAYERYSKKTRSGELDVLVAGRFIVTLRGTNLDAKAFRDAIAAFDLARLDALKSNGATS
jgi:hypothetical protein